MTRARRAVVGMVVLCGGLLLTGVHPVAAAEPAPDLSVERTRELDDGAIVTFRISGGPPRQYVWVKQCGPSPSAETCDDATRRQFRVLPDGTYRLSPKKLYALLEPDSGQVDCRTATCSLALTDNSGALLTTVPLHFRPDGPLEAPPTFRATPDRDLLDGQTVRVTGEGYEVQYHVSVLLCATGSANTLGCRPGTRPPATNDSGLMDRQVTLSAAFTSIGGDTVDCRPEGSCELVAFGSRVRGPKTVRTSLHFDPAQPVP
ncbi:neocarzinostatin apoprotein domain-containing protein [Streptomyces albicerus]|uniref:neocarzinostatin apoprotein domain-containing protein n=1 Tax=Streptomyces albicerus TaxID=2569859 RepID=UPI001788C928|nr:neocarzinostatin apoprotein domain-containing protein [Streptomyces albicerus]